MTIRTRRLAEGRFNEATWVYTCPVNYHTRLTVFRLEVTTAGTGFNLALVGPTQTTNLFTPGAVAANALYVVQLGDVLEAGDKVLVSPTGGAVGDIWLSGVEYTN